MTNVSPLERATRLVTRFEHMNSARHGETYGKNLLSLACHAALPAAISIDLVHLLRINFFFENTEQLPYTAEADLLLSPLCTEIGDELYEMDHEVRDILLQKLIDRYGRERLSEVAKLLWQYDQRFAPWADREMLERAQQLTALSFIDPTQAKQWLAEQPFDHYSLEQKAWFTAVNQEVLLAEKVALPPGEQPGVVGVGERPIAPDGDQTQPDPVEGVELPSVAVSPPDVSHIEASEDKRPTMAEERALNQESLADPSITGAQASSKLEEEKNITIDEGRRLPRELQNTLVIILLKVPGMEDFKARARLLQDIPNRDNILFHRTESLRADISGLVDQLSMTRLSDGQWALLVFINNAILFTNGTDISEQLKELRRQLEVLYGQTEQEPPLQEKSAEAPPSQKKTNVSRKTRSSKKTNTSKEKEAAATGDFIASQPESAPDRTSKLKTYRKIIEDIEDMLSMTSPRMLTIDALSVYEKEMQNVLGVIRKMPSSEVYSSMESRDAVLANIRRARDELALAIEELAKKGTSRNFISYIQKCCSYLEEALRHWY